MRSFIGDKHGYYERKWAEADQRNTRHSWNWAAFFFGLFWMAYRKMYRLAWIFGGIAFAEGALDYGFHLPEAVTNAMNLALAIVIGMQGNQWYRNHATARVAAITAATPAASLRAELAREGGTNPVAALAVLAGLVAIGAVLYFATGSPPVDGIRV